MAIQPVHENRQRVGFLACIPGLLKRFRVDPTVVLNNVGLDPNSLDDPEATIAYRAMGCLMAEAARATQCPHFGLELGKLIRTPTLGVLGELMRNSSTLRLAIQDFAANQHRNAHGGVVYLLETNKEALLGYAVYQPGMPGHDVICDAAAMGIFSVLNELAGPGRSPVSAVLLSRPEPPNVLPYKDAFGVELLMNAEQTAVAFPRKYLDLPIHGADARVRKELQERVRSTSPAGDLDLVTHLRRQLIVGILTGDVSAKDIANRVGMSRYTLDRRLISAGTSFQAVLDETRCEFTQQLLANTRLEISAIATILGYAAPSVLTRSFTRWTGVTPSAWRTNVMQSGLSACAVKRDGRQSGH